MNRVILILFFLSGACTLVYQVVWVRMLVLVLGMSVFAVSTVLTVFMAGLALGSVWFGRLVDRKGNGLRIYAYLELGIGLFALAFPFMLAGLDDLYTALYRLMDGEEYLFSLTRFLISFMVLLVPTTLMGATLPVLSKFVVTRLSRVGRGVGGLYALNTFGAAAGCLLAAYVLMEHFGTAATTYVAAGGNLLIAALAYLLSLKGDEAEPARVAPADEPARAEAADESPLAQPLSPSVARLIFWGYALSGFAALGYEVAWTRLLCMVLRITTIQSVSTILIAFLLGLAAGAAVGSRLVDRFRHPVSVFGVVEILLGLFGIASIAVFAAIPELMSALGFLPAWSGHILRLFIVAFAVMLLPTFLMGALFPIVGKLHVPRLGRLGSGIGNIYAANTTGAIFGAFITGFVLIPLAGTQISIQLLAWANVALGATVLILAPTVRTRSKVLVLVGLALPILLFTLFLPSSLMVEAFRRSVPGSELLYHDEDTGGTVTVHEFRDGNRLLKVNGAGEVPTDLPSIRTFRLLGNLPMLLHPAPEDVLVVAFGGGITLAAVEQHRPRRLDCVELVPGVVEASRYFARYNNRVFERIDGETLAVIIDDGRNHILRTERQYDVLISDATHPGTADSWVLYTRDFYELCERRLRERGIMAQWLPLHGLSVEDYKTILRTFRAVFPHASLWLTKDYSIMLGTPQRLRLDWPRLAEKLARPAVGTSLDEVDLGDPVSFVAAFVLDEEAIERYVGLGHVNTDDRPYLAFGDRARAGTQSGLPAMVSLMPHFIERVDGYLVGAGPDARRRVDRRFQSRRHTFLGDIALKLGDRPRARQQFRRALELDPGERVAERILTVIGSSPRRD